MANLFENKSNTGESLETLGEFGLIKHLTQYIELQNSSTKVGSGDDAAVLEFGADEQVVVSTDLLLEGVHFNPAYTPLKHLGYKAIVVNVSDIAAMNATPTQVTVSLGISNRFNLEQIEEIYAGMLLACKQYKVDLVGGDTTSSSSGLTISITAIGHAKKEELVYRNGAKETDLLVLTGDIGAAFLGLKILERENDVFQEDPNMQPDLSPYTYLLQRQLKPEARTDIKKLLSDLEVQPTSMIDISDGLSSEIIHICQSSGVGARLYEEKLPLDQQVISTTEEMNLDSTTIAINGGEDYELLFTVPIADFDKIKANPHFTPIGHIVAKEAGMRLVTRGEQEIELTAQGWNAFLKKNN